MVVTSICPRCWDQSLLMLLLCHFGTTNFHVGIFETFLDFNPRTKEMWKCTRITEIVATECESHFGRSKLRDGDSEHMKIVSKIHELFHRENCSTLYIFHLFSVFGFGFWITAVPKNVVNMNFSWLERRWCMKPRCLLLNLGEMNGISIAWTWDESRSIRTDVDCHSARLFLCFQSSHSY